MTALIKKPNEWFEEAEVENTLEALQKIVEGYIECVYLDDGIIAICNEEGKLLDLEPNMIVGYDVIVGNIVFVGDGGDEFISLTDKQIEIIKGVR